MSCNFCKNAIFENYGFDDREITIGLAAGGSRFPKEKQFKYCPKCGVSLSEPEPLTIDELRELDGKPVWCNLWYLVWLDDDKNVWLQRPITLGYLPLGNHVYDAVTECLPAEGLEVYPRAPKEDT